MARRNITTIICLVAALGFASAAGCKKKKTDDAGKGSAPASMATSMGPAAMGSVGPMSGRPMAATPMRPARPAATAGKGRVGAMPIPHDFMIITAHLKAVRATALYKKYEAKLKAMISGAMAKHKQLADVMAKCKVDLLSSVDAVSLGHPVDKKDAESTVLLVRGGFDAAKLLGCITPEMKKANVQVSDVTVGGKKGVTMTLAGKQMTVLVLAPKAVALIGQPVLARARQVLEGKLQSVEDTAVFKDGVKAVKAKPATVLSLLVPRIPAALTARVQFPIAKKIRTVVAMIGLPGDGLEVNLAADFGDEKTASTLARTLPTLLGFAKAKLGAIGAKLLKHLKVKADGTWVRLSLHADKELFEKLQGMAMGLVGKMVSMHKGSAPAAPGMGASPMRQAPRPVMAPKK